VGTSADPVGFFGPFRRKEDCVWFSRAIKEKMAMLYDDRPKDTAQKTCRQRGSVFLEITSRLEGCDWIHFA
jgi:hypothetical protein